MRPSKKIRRAVLVSFLGFACLMLSVASAFSLRAGQRIDRAHTLDRITILRNTAGALVQEGASGCELTLPRVEQEALTATQPGLSLALIRAGSPVRLLSGQSEAAAESVTEAALAQAGPHVQDFNDGSNVAWAVTAERAGGCRLLVVGTKASIRELAGGKVLLWFGISAAVLLWFLVWFSAALAHWINQRLKERSRLVIENSLKLEETRSALALEQERSELRKEFLTVTSHQFKTPLASILSAAEVLERYGDRLTTTQREGRVSKIRTQVNRLNHMVNEILELSRVMNDAKGATFDSIRVDELVQDLVKEQQQISGTSHDIISELEPVTAFVEPRLMEQAAENLLSNAVKYTPEGGKISITVSDLGEWFRLRVSDEGIGIPQAELTSLFTPFTRASNVGERAGTGIGLAIVDECISLHAGEIKVESELEKGTTFIITIPKQRTGISQGGGPAR